MTKAKKKISLEIEDYDPLDQKKRTIEINGIQKDGPIIERAAQYAIMVEKKGVWNALYSYLRGEERKKGISNLSLSYNIFALEWMCYFTYANKEILLLHPVMGAPAAECLVQQAYTSGCDTFVRLGTTGALSTNIPIYSIIVTEAAIRHDGTSDYYLPAGYPAIPDLDLTFSLRQELRKLALPVQVGTSYTTATRFRENLDALLDMNRTLDVLNIEMESATIFATAQALKMRAASISLVTDCLASENDTTEVEGTLKGVPLYDTYFSKGLPRIIEMFRAALEAFKLDDFEHVKYLEIKSEIDQAK